jgi:hypothetical protein
MVLGNTAEFLVKIQSFCEGEHGFLLFIMTGLATMRA